MHGFRHGANDCFWQLPGLVEEEAIESSNIFEATPVPSQNDDRDVASDARPRGVQSVETAVKLLAALAKAGGPMSLRDLSAAVNMPPAKVHRYMVSCVETGMVSHRRSGKYDLGRVAGEIGMAAVTRVDLINHYTEQMIELADTIGLSCMLSVWTDRGPTVVRWEYGATPMTTILGIGTVLPLLTTATGRAFLCHLPDRLVLPVMRAQAPKLASTPEAIRSTMDDKMVFRPDPNGSRVGPGIFTLARPCLGYDDQAVAVITIFAPTGEDVEPGSDAERALRGIS
ncbi:MAG: helix-turn-helix domain-containing protein [Pseudomonadota bacterium]